MVVVKVVTALCTFVGCITAMVMFWHEIGDLLHGERGPIVAEINLKNLCGTRDDVFVVRDIETGRYATFSGGRAKLRTLERNRLQIEYAPIFRDVEYNGSAYPAKANLTLTARCRSRPFLLRS